MVWVRRTPGRHSMDRQADTGLGPSGSTCPPLAVGRWASTASPVFHVWCHRTLLEHRVVSALLAVQVDASQFDHPTRRPNRSPASRKVVWNALDAVTAWIRRAALDPVDSVMEIDDGHGMSTEESCGGVQRRRRATKCYARGAQGR